MRSKMLAMLACSTIGIVSWASAGPAPATEAADTSGRYAVILDGSDAPGFINSVSGGGIKADVVSEPAAPGQLARKHLGRSRPAEIGLQINPADLTRNLLDWMADTLDMKHTRKNGSIVAANFDYGTQPAREFANALITEIGLPALEAGSNQPGYVTLKLAPQTTRLASVPATGVVRARAESVPPELNRWATRNFRLEIDGLDCTKVKKIDALTIKQSITPDPGGQDRSAQLDPVQVEYPNLTLTLPEAAARSFMDYAVDFVIKGHNDPTHEKQGKLILLTPDGRGELMRIDLQDIGIYGAHTVPVAGSGDKVVQVELYVQRMALMRPAAPRLR